MRKALVEAGGKACGTRKATRGLEMLREMINERGIPMFVNRRNLKEFWSLLILRVRLFTFHAVLTRPGVGQVAWNFKYSVESYSSFTGKFGQFLF